MGRRAKHEGSVYQRKKDGRRVASITLATGKRTSIYCKTQREAIKAMREAITARERVVLLTSKDQTLESFITAWLQDTAPLILRLSSVKRYREAMKHVLPTLGCVKLAKLSPQQIQQLYKFKLDAGSSPHTVQLLHRVLHRILKDAERWRLIERNMCNLVDPPGGARKEMQAWPGRSAARPRLHQRVRGNDCLRRSICLRCTLP